MNQYPEIDFNNKIQQFLYLLIWRGFIRGWELSEAKWKVSSQYILPGEDPDSDPDNYKPNLMDFS
jgi:hypothetical protein